MRRIRELCPIFFQWIGDKLKFHPEMRKRQNRITNLYNRKDSILSNG